MKEVYANDKWKLASMFERLNSMRLLTDSAIEKYMNTTVEKALERRSPCFITHNPNYLLSCALDEMNIVEADKGEQDTREFAHWVGYLYRHWTLLRGTPGTEVIKIAPVSRLAKCYIYHTMDLDFAIDRLCE